MNTIRVNVSAGTFLLGLCTFIFSIFPGIPVFAQCTSAKDIYTRLEAIPGEIPVNEKLVQAKKLLELYKKCGYPKDSVYVRLHDRIGLFSYINKDIANAIRFAEQGIYVAMTKSAGYSKTIAAKTISNLGFYYGSIGWYTKSILYYDSAISIASTDINGKSIEYDARFNRIVKYLDLGDYQKCIDECTYSISQPGNPHKAKLAVKRMEAFFKDDQFEAVEKEAIKILRDTSIHDAWTTNNTQRLLAMVAVKRNHLHKADSLFSLALKGKDAGLLMATLADYGNYLVEVKRDYPLGVKVYLQMAAMKTGSEKTANALVNISQVRWRQKDYADSWSYFLKATELLMSSGKKLETPGAAYWNSISNKDLMMVMLNNKTELLLTEYRLTGKRVFLNAAVSAAKTADSVFTMNRRELVAEQSKLFWRQRTRELYQNALDASFLANDPNLAFYFMEKSRAVLLNDKLNERLANAILPSAVAVKEHELRLAVLQEQFILNSSSNDYNVQQLKILDSKEKLEQYIRSIEKNYPSYYQLKYADKVPSLAELQQYLKVNQQSFIHYFMTDTVAYIMAITPSGTILKKLSAPTYNKEKFIAFLQYCSQPAKLNADYKSYLQLSNDIHAQLFQPLHISKGRVIVCPDNFLIPFEAIATNNKGNHLLVEDYAFSYVYSARNLLINFPIKPANGNFLGMAPVSFASFLHVPTLHNSADAATKSAAFFNSSKLITGKEADKRSFLNNIARYEVVNVFSHALADSSDNEPAIYMGDSVIYLSELQLLNDISAQLVLLSACQTSVGKNATGEGIYSLARGLAAVGIPAVAATLWEADEDAIYALSEKFNEGISKGLPKDIALQQAKVWYLTQFSEEKTLPSYWANMILIGNASPVHFSEHHNYLTWGIIVFGIVLLCMLIILIRRKYLKREKLQ